MICMEEDGSVLMKKKGMGKTLTVDKRRGIKMQTKYLPLLKQLFEANTWVTAVSLASTLGISARAVKA